MRINAYTVAAVAGAASLLWAWGTGENGDLGFAGVTVATAAVMFGTGAWSRRWWAVPAIAAAWFCGWMFVGSTFDPDGYTSVTAFFAPGVALFVGFGVGAGRRGMSDRSPTKPRRLTEP